MVGVYWTFVAISYNNKHVVKVMKLSWKKDNLIIIISNTTVIPEKLGCCV